MRQRLILALFAVLVPGFLLAGLPRPKLNDGCDKSSTDPGAPSSAAAADGPVLDISLPLGLPLHYDEPAVPTESGSTPTTSESKPQKLVYTFELRDDIGPPSWRQAQAALREARSMKADVVLIHMNCFSGSLEEADNIRKNLLSFEKPVLVYIDDPKTSSGSTMISLACDSIYMSPKARLGAATVKDQSGNTAPTHYQQYMRSLLRNTAEATSRNPNTAEAMSKSAGALLLTAQEAVSSSYCEGQATSMQDVLRMAGLNDYKVVQYTPGAFDRFIDLLLQPAIAFVLLSVFFASLFSALRRRFIAFSLLFAFATVALYQFSNFAENRVQTREFLLLGSGLLLLLWSSRIKSAPALWLKGLGLLLLVVALAFARIDSYPVFDPEALHQATDTLLSLAFVLSALALGFVLQQKWLRNAIRNFLVARPEKNPSELIQLPVNLVRRNNSLHQRV